MTRQPRPTREPAPALPSFDRLDRAHRAALEMLQTFEQLLTQLENQGLDAQTQQSARAVLAFFDGPGRNHHADEESLVFPTLLASGPEDLIRHVHRLQQDHGWIEEDWRALAPQVEAIASGYNWYDLAMLRAALPIFAELYHEHIALEESLVYPAARRQQQALTEGQTQRGATG